MRKKITQTIKNNSILASCIVFLLSLNAITSFAQTCNVTDYLYLNDVTAAGGYVHKLKLNSNVTATEIYSTGTKPWFPAGGILDTPHGLGQDLNGNLYIGQTGGGPIAKIKCNGTVVDANFINDGGYNFVSKGGYLFVNSGSNNQIRRYSLCDGSLQGYITLNGDFSYGTETLIDWGLDIDPDGTFYVSAGFGVLGNHETYLYRFKPTDANFTAHTGYTANLSKAAGVSLKPGSGTAGISNVNEVWGITHDAAGNMYLIVRDWGTDTEADETWILKFDKNFNLVDSIVETTASNLGGIRGARGLVYYAPWNMLLVAGGPNGDCIAKVKASDMTYAGALEARVPGQTPKTLRIASEACPVSASVTVDTTLCNVQVGDIVFLQDIIGKCNAPICGGTWAASSGNTGVTFQQCDLSFTITDVALGCGKFTLTNVGGTCGNFTITVNVNFANVTAPVIAGDQTVCTDSETPAAFTTTTSATGSNTIKYQWQKSTTSCTAGFSDISGAISSTYTPTTLSQTSYFRVVTTVDGGCTTPFGSCADTSNCITVTTKVCSPTCTNPTVGTPVVTQVTCNAAGTAANNDASIVISGISNATVYAFTTDGSTPAFAGATTVSGSVINLTGLSNPASATIYKFRIFNGAADCFTDVTATLNPKTCSPTCTNPTVGSPVVTQATCNAAGTAANNDASIVISGISNATVYAFTTDGSTPAFAGATTVSGSVINLTGLSNPASATTYKFRIFNGSATCFTDITATLNPKTCSPTCTAPNAGVDFTMCLPKTSTNLIDAASGYEWVVVAGNPAAASINATTGVIAGMTTAGIYKFNLQKTGEATCFDEIQITVSNGDAPIVLCNDGSTSYTLIAQAGLTNVIWYSMDGTQVGTGNSLIVSSNTGGLQDGTETYYYIGKDGTATGCDVQLCCPVKFLTQDCCKTPNCLGVTVIKN